MATMKGQIEECISKSSSKTTKDLQEVFSMLDQPVSSKQPRFILVEGTPGVGKSVLLKHVSYLWAKGELLKNSDLLFLLYLRDPAVQQMNSLHDLVHHFYRYDEKSKDCCMAQILKDNGHFLTILLDGFDELPVNLQQNGFIADIIQRKVLPACAIVLSSRPHASSKLHCDISCRIEILGFSEDDQIDFIQQSLDNQPDKILPLNEYLKNHPVITSLCFIPFNMTILLFLYKQEMILPNSSTDLYSLFICLTICRHLRKSGITLEKEFTNLNHFPQPYSNIIHQLSQLAFEGLEMNQLVFTMDEMKKRCPDISTIAGVNGFGLLQAVEYVGITSKTISVNFIHYSMQEFLAAYYVTSLSSNEELSVLQEKFWEDKYLNMFYFYVALTEGQRVSFRRFLSCEDEEIAIDSKFLFYQLDRIWLYRCFTETADCHMCDIIEKKFSNGKITIYHTLSSNLLDALGLLLTCKSIKKWFTLDLRHCYIRDAGIRILHHHLTQASTDIAGLRLCNNDLSYSSDTFITDIVFSCNVKVLDISFNETIGQTEDFFPTLLSQPFSQLETLHANNINLSLSAATTIFTLIKEKGTGLKGLSMANNNIPTSISSIIVESLKCNSALEYLILHGNQINGSSAYSIVFSLRTNNTLRYLSFPNDYSETEYNKIVSLQYLVIDERKCFEFPVELNIEFK